jgi:hypothetical protein
MLGVLADDYYVKIASFLPVVSAHYVQVLPIYTYICGVPLLHIPTHLSTSNTGSVCHIFRLCSYSPSKFEVDMDEKFKTTTMTRQTHLDRRRSRGRRERRTEQCR